MHNKKAPLRDASLTRILNYYKLPRKDKIRFVETPGAQNLLEVLPTEIAETFREGFLAGLPGKEVDGWNKVVEYFNENSPIIREITKEPGTYSMLEKIYTGTNLQTSLDHALCYTLSSEALRNRIEAVIEFTRAYLRSKVLSNNRKPLVLNLGAGTGRDTIEVCKRELLVAQKTEIHCIDLDPEALATGINIARSARVSNIRFLQKDISRLKYRKEADFGLLIGILCPLEFNYCVRFLRIIKRYFKPGAPVIAACVLEEMLKKDLFTAYLLREICGWELCFRRPGEVRRMFEEAGYRWGGVFYDVPTRFYAIGIGLA